LSPAPSRRYPWSRTPPRVGGTQLERARGVQIECRHRDDSADQPVGRYGGEYIEIADVRSDFVVIITGWRKSRSTSGQVRVIS